MQNASIEYLWAIWNVKIIYLLLLLSLGATWAVEASRALSSGYVGLGPTAQRPEQSSELKILYIEKLNRNCRFWLNYIFNGRYKCTLGFSRGIRGIAFMLKIKGSDYT